jgi:predicted O-methyltransferase YrrM
MIRHVVMWKLNGETEEERAEQAAQITERLGSLIPLIPELKTIELGSDIGDEDGQYDLVLISDHDDLAGLRAYQNHPEHLRVVDYIKAQVAARASVDFEV